MADTVETDTQSIEEELREAEDSGQVRFEWEYDNDDCADPDDEGEFARDLAAGRVTREQVTMHTRPRCHTCGVVQKNSQLWTVENVLGSVILSTNEEEGERRRREIERELWQEYKEDFQG